MNCGPRSYFNHIAFTCLLFSHCLLYCILYCFPLDTLITFVSSKPVRLTTSSQVGSKVLVCVCAGSALLLAEDESTSIVKRRPCWSVTKPVRITFSCHCLLFSWSTLNLGFLLRENELLYSSYLPLGVPNGLVIHHASSSVSGAVAGDLKKNKLPHQLHIPTSTWHQQLFFCRRCRGKVEDFCEGSFRTHVLYFAIVLL